MSNKLIDILASKDDGDEEAQKRLRMWLDTEGCDTPGMKKRSGGKGRGLARGKGKGPMGVPAGKKAKVMFGTEE